MEVIQHLTKIASNQINNAFTKLLVHDLRIIFSSIDGVMFLIIVVTNTLMIVACKTSKALRPVFNRFMISYAVANLLMGFFMLYHIASLWDEEIRSLRAITPFCLGQFAVVSVVWTASVLSLTALTVNRWLLSRHHVDCTERAARLAKFGIVCIWIYSIGVGLVPVIWERLQVNTDYCVIHSVIDQFYWFAVVIQIVVIICTGIIFYGGTSHSMRTFQGAIYNNSLERTLRNYMSHITQTNGLAGRLIALFIVCWTPYYVMASLLKLQITCDHLAVVVAHDFSLYLGFFSCIAVPILVLTRSKLFGLRHIFGNIDFDEDKFLELASSTSMQEHRARPSSAWSSYKSEVRKAIDSGQNDSQITIMETSFIGSKQEERTTLPRPPKPMNTLIFQDTNDTGILQNSHTIPKTVSSEFEKLVKYPNKSRKKPYLDNLAYIDAYEEKLPVQGYLPYM